MDECFEAAYRARRTCLSVPGSSSKMIEKAKGLPADEVFLDLEDAVAVDAKAQARTQAAIALSEPGWSGQLARRPRQRLDDAVDIRRRDRGGVDSRGPTRRHRAAKGHRRIAHSRPGSAVDSTGDHTWPASGSHRHRGPDRECTSVGQSRRDRGRAAGAGADPRAWVLHPDQIAAGNEIFSPRQAEYDRAELILEAYEWHTSAAGGARGAVMLGDEVLDEASRKMALVIAGKGRAAGMTRQGDRFRPPS